MVLHELLSAPVTSQSRAEIIRQLWPSVSSGVAEKEDLDWDAYFEFYTRQCELALLDEGRHLSARNHEDLVGVTRLLRTEATKEDVMSKLRRKLSPGKTKEAEDKMLKGTINLATRILAMIHVGPLGNEISLQDSIPWKDGPLDKAIHAHFNTKPDPYYESIKLGIDFTARNIEHDTNIKIIWTDNLLDHLRLVNGDKNLCIFHQISFLKHTEHGGSTMYPKDLIRETLDTLTLLLPGKDSKTKRWLDDMFLKSTHPTVLDKGLSRIGSFTGNDASRRLEHFHFWCDRLSAIREVVHDARSPLQAMVNALNDSRQGDLDRWINSWVAIVAIALTVFFGLVQSIEGAIQVYKAYHPSTG